MIEHVKANTKYEVPIELEQNLMEIRKLFTDPDVVDSSDIQIKFGKPDVEGLKLYLIGDLGFNEERVLKSIDRLKKALNISSQRSIESFFTPKTT